MRIYTRCLVGVVLYLGCAQFAFLAAIQNPGNPEGWDKARLTDLVEGRGHRPFVYRALLPGTVRVIRDRLPQAVRAQVTDFANRFVPLGELFESTPAADEDHPVTYLIAYALEFACLIAFALTLRQAVAFFYAPGGWMTDLLPLGALIGLPVFYRYITFDYDFPQLFLFSLGFLLLARRRWFWFYPALAFCALNKETAVLLVVVHLLGHWTQLSRRALFVHAAIQLAIVGVIRACLQFVFFPDNPGAPVEIWLTRNWEMLSDPGRWGFLFFHFGWAGNTALVIPTNFNLLFLLLLPLVFWRWSDRPLFLRRSIWIAPLLVVLMMFMGQIDEMRVYYEAYVVLYLLAAGAICAGPVPNDQRNDRAPTNAHVDHKQPLPHGRGSD